ncbi:MAG: TatD family hydrolase [Candidatus Aenigmatarchaeota archaeon]
MIDSHCHLEQPEFSEYLDQVIQRCRNAGLRAVVSSCSRPVDFEKSLNIANKYKGFVFITAGFHPEFMKKITEEGMSEYIKKIINNKDKIVGIGEVGLDYAWIKEPELQEKSRKLFAEMIRLANRLNLPLVIHSRDAHPDTLRILEENKASRVLLHMWGGHHKELMDKVNELGYFVSLNTTVLRSKGYRKVARDTPLERMMLETDSPWLGVKKQDDSWVIDQSIRNEPTAIKIVARKIAEIKKLSFDKIWEACRNNAISFFALKL